MDRREFERLVADTLRGIPAELRSHVENVQLIVEDDISDELRKEMGLEEDETLYGLYIGTALTERSVEYSDLPDRIIIFRRPLLEDFDDPNALRREVARTVIHEIAHHFGIGEERLAELGWD